MDKAKLLVAVIGGMSLFLSLTYRMLSVIEKALQIRRLRKQIKKDASTHQK
jgi:hypothetical protein